MSCSRKNTHPTMSDVAESTTAASQAADAATEDYGPADPRGKDPAEFQAMVNAAISALKNEPDSNVRVDVPQPAIPRDDALMRYTIFTYNARAFVMSVMGVIAATHGAVEAIEFADFKGMTMKHVEDESAQHEIRRRKAKEENAKRLKNGESAIEVPEFDRANSLLIGLGLAYTFHLQKASHRIARVESLKYRNRMLSKDKTLFHLVAHVWDEWAEKPVSTPNSIVELVRVCVECFGQLQTLNQHAKEMEAKFVAVADDAALAKTFVTAVRKHHLVFVGSQVMPKLRQIEELIRESPTLSEFWPGGIQALSAQMAMFSVDFSNSSFLEAGGGELRDFLETFNAALSEAKKISSKSKDDKMDDAPSAEAN